jgi:hypothetical protein
MGLLAKVLKLLAEVAVVATVAVAVLFFWIILTTYFVLWRVNGHIDLSDPDSFLPIPDGVTIIATVMTIPLWAGSLILIQFIYSRWRRRRSLNRAS